MTRRMDTIRVGRIMSQFKTVEMGRVENSGSKDNFAFWYLNVMEHEVWCMVPWSMVCVDAAQ